jgi:hypothetical protein
MARSHAPLVLLLALTATVYAQGLWGAGFVWDDVPLILLNEALGSWDGVSSLLGADLWASSGAGRVESGYFRPLVLLSFSLDTAVFGDGALGFHLHSIGWHLLAVVFLYLLLKDLVGEGRAVAGAALFALHPVQSECVAWISARNDLMAAALGLACMVAIGGRGQSRLRWWLGVVLAMAAVLSKESAALLPLLALMLERFREPVDRSPGSVSAVVLGIGLVIVMRIVLGIGGATLPPAEGWALVWAHGAEWGGTMLASLTWPEPISSARDLHWSDTAGPGRMVLGWGSLCVLSCVAVLQNGQRRRMAVGGLLWLVCGIGLLLIPMADKGGFGDRFWYLPLVGLAIYVAAVLPRRVSRWWAAAFAVPALIVLAVRLPDWQDDAQLWASAARDVPTPVNHVGLAHAMAIGGRNTRAHVGFAGALSSARLATEACPQVIGSAVRMGHPSQGARMGRWALARGCVRTESLTGWLATAEALSDDWEAAGLALRLGPAGRDMRGRAVAAALATRVGDEVGRETAIGGQPGVAQRADGLLKASRKRMLQGVE